MKKKVIYGLILIFLIVASFGTGVIANESGLTFAGEDELENFEPVAPQKRIDKVYRQGNKIYIVYEDLHLIPISTGDSMLPLVT